MATTNTTPPSTLPSTYRTLEFHSASAPATIVTKPTPALPPPAGTVILRPLHASVVSYASEVLQNGNPRRYGYPLPLVPGPSCVARLATAPPDAPASLRPGQLVLLDPVIRPRARGGAAAAPGSAASAFLLATHGEGPEARAAMEGVWRDGCFAEVVRAPLENVHPLDEAALLGGHGYALRDLGALAALAVPYGGLSRAGVRPGQTVVVAPATGAFGGAAVRVALALGARVVAMGRDEEALRDLEARGKGRVATVRMSGSVGADVEGIRGAAARLVGGQGTEMGQADVFLEISPPGVVDGPGKTVPYITAALKALRPGGRAVLMGGLRHDVSLPVCDLVHDQKSIQGAWMYTPEQLGELIRLVETGILKVGEGEGFKCVGVFALEEWEQAFETAARDAKAGKFVVLEPNKE